MDLLCENYQRARENRGRIRAGAHNAWWVWYEALVKSWPRKKQMPDWMLGHLPVVGKTEERELHEYGIYEINE